jgi:hypothetical protein
MSSIPRVSLEDTLYLVQLMRETALEKGKEAQASRLTPVESGIRDLVTKSRQAQPTPAQPSGILGQADFKKILDLSRDTAPAQAAQQSSTASVLERNNMVQAMAAADMPDVDIARQMGMTRDEVRLVLNVQKR